MSLNLNLKTICLFLVDQLGQKLLCQRKLNVWTLKQQWSWIIRASSVCLSIKSGCMMLDFPELFAPARIVSGRMSMVHSFASDLKPLTAILVMPSTASFDMRGVLLSDTRCATGRKLAHYYGAVLWVSSCGISRTYTEFRK